ncbi:MAG: hypothetical protein ACFHX7_24125 [Pseudomonadota bacterium]
MTPTVCPVCSSPAISLRARLAWLLARDTLNCTACGTRLAVQRRERMLAVRRGVWFQIIIIGGITLGLYLGTWWALAFTAALLILANLLFEVTGQVCPADAPGEVSTNPPTDT